MGKNIQGYNYLITSSVSGYHNTSAFKGFDIRRCLCLLFIGFALFSLACNCDTRGSASLQCNRLTGKCECAPGVGGEKCDRCDRGTTGTLPYCVPCGECFTNWDTIINELRSMIVLEVPF